MSSQTITAKPTHTATLIFPSALTNRKSKGSVKAFSTSVPDAIARARDFYTKHLIGVNDADIKVTFVKLPTAKLGAKLLEKHDYLMLTAVFPEGTFRFTTSRSGNKMSGDFVKTPEGSVAFRLLCLAVTAIKQGETVGSVMRGVTAKASAATNSTEFFNSLK